MRKLIFIFFLTLFLIPPVFGQARSFETLFPGLEEGQKTQVFSSKGLVFTTGNVSELRLVPASEFDIAGPVLSRNFSCLVESLLMIPYGHNSIELLDIYNALGKIRDLTGRLYHSATRDAEVPLFEDATRIKGPRENSPIPDPPGALSIPPSETIHVRIKDINFGNSFYRADIATGRAGLLYHLSNTRALSYLFIPIIKEDNFVTQLYFEPLEEGVLVYSIAGAEVSNFVASRVDISSAIRKRLEVIISWVIDGVTVFK
ncbi:MAG: hypothetical protein LBT95_09055 [Treponema sp.]|jgi:hypothetical protein|nr:hypothetical protein [Treponema sp.]